MVVVFAAVAAATSVVAEDIQALGSPPPKPEGVEEDPRDDGVGTAEHSYWLAPGCVRMLPRHGDSYSPVGFFELGSRAVGKVQCCSNGTSATYCTRAVQKVCLSGDKLLSHDKAREVCEGQGFRLCSKAEIMTEDSAGCCTEEDLCGLDRALIWTSDHALQSENANLWRFVEDLQKVRVDVAPSFGAPDLHKVNQQLKAEWMESRAQSRRLKAMYEESASKPRKEGVVARDLETMRRHEETEESIAALKNLDETLAAKSAPEPSS